jgi:transposase InsO family protein
LKQHKCDVLYSRKQLLSPHGVALVRFQSTPVQETSSVLPNEANTTISTSSTEPITTSETNVNPARPSAIVSKSVVVDAHTETVAICSVVGTKPTSKWLYSEPSLRVEARTGLLVANAVINNSSRVPVRVANFSSKPITLAAGTHLAQLYPVKEEPVLTCLPEQDKTKPQSNSETDDEILAAIETAVNDVPSNFTDSEKQQLKALLIKYKDLFSNSYLDLGCAKNGYFFIETGDAKPIKQPPRRVPYHLMPHLQAEVDKLLEAGIIQPSTSEWSSPVVMVRKKDGTWRLCVDYRRLNNVTKKDSFPLPDIRDLFDSLQGHCIFTTLDLLAGYHQIPVHPESIPKTAFVTPNGLYEYLCMPFGPCNGPPTFQRIALNMFAGMIGKQCLSFLDDVIAIGKSVAEHLQNLDSVFSRLRENNLKVKLSKCVFMRNSVKFLGHVISKEGLQTDPDKVAAIQKMPPPNNVNGVQQVLGLLNYYRTFVKDFAHIARPLTQLLEKDRPFNWTTDCQNAFDTLKHRLSTAPVRMLPRFDRKFILDTDASGYAISGVLSQADDDGSEHPVAYFSRTLSKEEQNYSTTRRELLAVIESMEYFRIYLIGRRFLLRTDHASIRWLTNFNDPTGQLARWLARLAAFDYEFQHRPGRFHANADALSRLCEMNAAIESVEPFPSFAQAELIKAQKADKILGTLRQWVEAGARPTNHEASAFTRELRTYWAKFEALRIQDDVLYMQMFDENKNDYMLRPVVPVSLRTELIRQVHSMNGAGGHFSGEKTAAKLAKRFFWVGLHQDTLAVARSCEMCSKRKTARPNHAHLIPIKCGYPFERVYMDMIGPLPITPRGNRYILTMIDGYSKWAEAIPSPSLSAIVTARLILNGWIAHHGAPTILHSDLGSNFISRVVRELCQIFDITPTNTTAYHAAGNGAVERFNRTLLDLIATGIQDATDNWDLNLNLVLMAHHSTVTTHGYTPFFILHGFEMKVPLDLQYGLPPTHPTGTLHEVVRAYHESINQAYKNAREHLDAAHRSQQSAYDRRARGSRYQPGDQVYVFTPVVKKGKFHKFNLSWDGPVTVLKRQTDVDYLVVEPETGKQRLVHFDRLKIANQLPPHLQAEASGSAPESEHSETEDESYRQLAATPSHTQVTRLPAPVRSGRETQLNRATSRQTPLQTLARAEVEDARRCVAIRERRQAAPVGEMEPVSRPAVMEHHRTNISAPYALRERIPANTRYRDFVTLVSQKNEPPGSSKMVNLEVPARGTSNAAFRKTALHLFTFLLLLGLANADDLESSHVRAPGQDVLVLPALGAVATRCGQVIVEHQRLMFNLVLHLNATFQKTYQVANSCGDGIFRPEELQQLANYVELDPSQAVPAWLQASIRLPNGRYLDEENSARLEARMKNLAGNFSVKTPRYTMTELTFKCELHRRRLARGDSKHSKRYKQRPHLEISDQDWESAFLEAYNRFLKANRTETLSFRKRCEEQIDQLQQSQTQSRQKRFIAFDPISFAIATTALGMSAYTVVEIQDLKGRLSKLAEHVQHLDERTWANQDAIIKLGQLQNDMYHYTQRSFVDTRNHIDSMVCNTRNAFYALAIISQRNQMINKLYTDLSTVISTLFSGRLSPILVPERTLRELIRINELALLDTVFWDDPLIAYRYASVVPVWPLTVDRIGFVMILPNLKRPTLTPLYCTSTIGLLRNYSLTIRYRLPPKLIHLEDIKINGTVLSALPPNMLANHTTGFAIPLIEQCRVLDDELIACPESVALTPWDCETNRSMCTAEIKRHDADEIVITPHGYAVRTSRSCAIAVVNGTTTNVSVENGFAFVPFLRFGTLRCGEAIAVPLELRGMEYAYTYEVKPMELFNITDYAKVAHSEWTGVAELNKFLEIELKRKEDWKDWTLKHSIQHLIDKQAPWIVIAISTVSVAAFALGIFVWCKLRTLYMYFFLARGNPVASILYGRGKFDRKTRKRLSARHTLVSSGEIELPDEANIKQDVLRTRIKRLPFWKRVRNRLCTIRSRKRRNARVQATCAISTGIQTNATDDNEQELLNEQAANERRDNEKQTVLPIDSPPNYATAASINSIYPSLLAMGMLSARDRLPGTSNQKVCFKPDFEQVNTMSRNFNVKRRVDRNTHKSNANQCLNISLDY